MVQLGLSNDFKHQVIQWDGATVPMEQPRSLLGQTDPKNHDMHEVVMQTAEPVSTREATEILAKTLDITYFKADLEQVAASATQINSEEKTKLLCIHKDFE